MELSAEQRSEKLDQLQAYCDNLNQKAQTALQTFIDAQRTRSIDLQNQAREAERLRDTMKANAQSTDKHVTSEANRIVGEYKQELAQGFAAAIKELKQTPSSNKRKAEHAEEGW